MKHARFTLKVISVSVISLVYVLLLWHFLISNFMGAVGGNYKWQPAVTDTGSYISDGNISTGLNCGSSIGADDYMVSKGFPVAVEEKNQFYCGDSLMSPESVLIGRIINVAYLAVITGLYYVGVRKITGKTLKALLHR